MTVRSHVAVVLAFVGLLAAPVSAQTRAGAVSGRVADSNGQAVSRATVSIVELNRAATTDSSGAFQLGELPPGRYNISARRLGYTPAAQSITVGDVPLVVNLTLELGVQRIEPVNVTATRAPTAALASPLPTSVLTGDQVDREGGVSLAHSVARLAGVRNVSTGQEIGKPMIRGLFGPRILVLADGSRLEDYSWSDEDGPSIDARIAQRIEVIRGPASVLYGSDALAGVVNVVPADVPFSADGAKQRRGALEAYGASNNIELGGAGMAEGSQSKYGWRLTGTGRVSQNYQTPDGSVPNSSFWAFNGEGALGIRGDRDNTVFRGAHYGGEFHLLESTGPEAGDPNGGPVRQVMDDRLQVTNNHLFGGLRLETKAQFQRHSLTEVSDDCVPAPGQTTCVKVKDQKAFGLVLNTGTVDVLAHHSVGDALSGTIGVSGTAQASNSSGPIFLVPSATINSAAAFAFEQLTAGQFTFVAGARGDSRHLSSDAQPEISQAADNRSWSAASADGGIVFRPISVLAIVANYGTGWRAPTLFDLYANGPNLAEARFEIGDPSLGVERSKNIDGGFRLESDLIRADVSVYRNTVDDYIFTTPTPATQNGLRVFRHEQTDARLTGAEASVEARVTSRLTLRGSHDFVNGDDRRAGTPLPLIPPPRTILGTSIALGRVGSWQNVSVGGDVEINQTQRRLNPNDFATDGYTLLNLDLSTERVMRARPLRLDLDVRNALNTSYKDYLSRFKEFASAPGISIILKASAGAW
ncbi:MAG TPA: TonB-dependent receptor [Gemmatimonadaceae bacterium]